MVYEAIVCKHCGKAESVKRHGVTPGGKPRYRCYECGKTFINKQVNRGHERDVQEKIIEMALNGSGVRQTGRVLGISPMTVAKYLKKK